MGLILLITEIACVFKNLMFKFIESIHYIYTVRHLKC